MMAVVKPKRRSTARVSDTESAGSKVIKNAKHREARPEGSAKLIGGELQITAQLSELVPVAQYANVTIGPVMLSWTLGGVEMEALLDVNWDDIEDSEDIDKQLDEAQLAAWTRARAGLRATMMLIEFTIAEDREAVERSVSQHNEAEAAKSKKG